MHRWRAVVGLVVALEGGAAAAATVERFSPQGEIRAVRQVAARFSEDMVRFGDSRAPAPFGVACAEPGQGRWVDARNWVFDFNRDLPPGVKCAFKVKPEVRAIAAELGPRGVRVNAVVPGLLATGMGARLDHRVAERARTGIPLGRFGTGAEVASAVLFLASERAAYVVGQAIAVDGGLTA
mgnify:CR=1 FL=1